MAPTVRHNCLRAEPEATIGNTIRHIAVEHPTETAQRPIDSAAQLAATPSLTGRPAQETRSDAREEVFRVQVIAVVPVRAALAVGIVVVAGLAEVLIASEAAMSRVPLAATAAPSDQVPGEATTAPPRDPPAVADPPASAAEAVAVVAVVVVAAGVVKENHEEHIMNSRSPRKNVSELPWIAIILACTFLSGQVLGAYQTTSGTQAPSAQSPAAPAPHPVEGETFATPQQAADTLIAAAGISTRPHSRRSSAPMARRLSSRVKAPRTANEPWVSPPKPKRKQNSR